MSVSIKVAIRCRPFTCDDKLGVNLQQEKEEDAVVELINSKYSTNRFAFTWAWWSAYGWKRRLKGDDALATVKRSYWIHMNSQKFIKF